MVRKHPPTERGIRDQMPARAVGDLADIAARPRCELGKEEERRFRQRERNQQSGGHEEESDRQGVPKLQRACLGTGIMSP